MVSTLGILECEFQIFYSNDLLLKVNGLKIIVTSKGDFSEAIESTSITDKGSGSAYIAVLPFSSNSDLGDQALSTHHRGPYSVGTAFVVSKGETTLKMGMNSGDSQKWLLGELTIGGSGCYLKS